MIVSDILRQKGTYVASTRPSVSIAEAAAVMSREHIGALLVRDDAGAIKGILSERDIVGALARAGASCLERAVGDYMTREVVNCSSADPIKDIMTAMTEKRIRHLPVIDDNRLAGIISIGDVVKHRLREAEEEVEIIKEYVATA